MKKRPSRNVNVQNFWLYVFGMVFNAVAILIQDFDAVMNKGFFHGYSLITTLMILNHALRSVLSFYGFVLLSTAVCLLHFLVCNRF
uniref:Uncharacterized protein n=1 Tax=Rhizophora mucronata TaxID=61149 RepID=A0A2P2LEL3_RHIMU